MTKRTKVELFEQIRKAHVGSESPSIRDLARTYGVHRRTVRQALSDPVPPPRKVTPRTSPSLEPWKKTIQDWIEADRDVPKKQRESIVCDVLDRFQIVAKKDLYPNQLSGGQQQLVGVARALVAKPALLLADEPTGNLHSDQGREIMQLFKQLNQDDGVTIVQVTHSNENAAYGSRIVRLADGMVVK